MSAGPTPPRSPLALAERALDSVDRLLAGLAAVAILVVMVLVCCDVAGRYLLGRPLPWVYDLVSIYVVNLVLYFFASEVLRTRSHIELDLKLRLLPERAWHWLQALGWLGVAAVLAIAARLAALSALQSWSAGEIHPGLYEWPVWLEKGIVALGLGLLLLRVALRLVQFLASGCDGTVFNADEPAHASGPE